jgi:PAS domain S-box-containing protein
VRQDLGTRKSGGWEGLFWLVFESSTNALMLLDEQRCVVEANESALSLFGRTRGDFVGVSVIASIKPADRPRADEEWERFLISGDYSGSRVMVRGDGVEVPTHFAARLEFVAGRRLAIYVVVPDDALSPAPAEQRADLPLTNREREVIALIALGRETPQIAAELHVASETVRTHVRSAMSKLGAATRAQLVAIVLADEHAMDLAAARTDSA